MPEGASEGNEFDVVILGAGSGGYACALRAAQLGLSVALVEKDKLGGTCLHVGCIPTKALLHAAEVADAARESEKFGVRATLDGIDMAGVNAYKDGVVRRLLQGAHRAGQGPRHHRRRGHRPAHRSADGRGRRHVVRRQGGRARLRLLLALAARASRSTATGCSPPSTRSASSRCPRSVIVLGGGVIGCEFASVWRSFGAEVTIIEALPHLVPAEDEQSSKALERAFRKRKIAFSTGTRFESVKTTDRRRHGDRRGRQDLRGRPAARRRRTRTGDRRPRLRGAGHRDGARLRHRRRALPHQRRGRLRRRRHRARPAARPPRLPAGRVRGRGDRRPLPRRHRRDRDPARHLLRARRSPRSG